MKQLILTAVEESRHVRLTSADFKLKGAADDDRLFYLIFNEGDLRVPVDAEAVQRIIGYVLGEKHSDIEGSSKSPYEVYDEEDGEGVDQI